MQTIKLNLIPSLIIESVKGETYIKGSLDRVSNENATGVSYQEIAGDESVHERKLLRTMYSAIEELKGHLSDYLEEGVETSGDNITSSIDNDNDAITIQLNVSNRFNKAYTSSLARLCSSYVENKMLVLWWTALRSDQATLYVSLLGNDLAAIKRCFIKVAPSVPKNTYTQTIDVSGTTLSIVKGESADITYTIDAGVVDDIECKASNRNVIVQRTHYGFNIVGMEPGTSVLTLYSRHNSDVSKTVDVTILSNIDFDEAEEDITDDVDDNNNDSENQEPTTEE